MIYSDTIFPGNIGFSRFCGERSAYDSDSDSDALNPRGGEEKTMFDSHYFLGRFEKVMIPTGWKNFSSLVFIYFSKFV